MKKFLILIVSLFIMVPISVKAEGIPNYFVNATVEKNGDITVEEYFYLNGSFNGMERIIEYRNKDAYSFDSTSNYYGGSTIHNGDGVSIKSVKALAINPNFDFNSISGDNFKKVSSADPGDYGVYTVEEDMDGETVRIFLPDKKNKAFYIKYVLNNMAISHNDVGEIGWNIIGDSFRENVGHFRGIVNFPYNDIDLRAWAHGPLNGNVSILSNEKLQVTIDNLSSYTPIDV